MTETTTETMRATLTCPGSSSRTCSSGCLRTAREPNRNVYRPGRGILASPGAPAFDYEEDRNAQVGDTLSR
jgi:hypothetical protein